MNASDQAVPEKTAVSSVYVRIRRDLRDPIFESAPYSATVKESDPIGKSVFQLRGRDDDKMVGVIVPSQHMY